MNQKEAYSVKAMLEHEGVRDVGVYVRRDSPNSTAVAQDESYCLIAFLCGASYAMTDRGGAVRLIDRIAAALGKVAGRQ